MYSPPHGRSGQRPQEARRFNRAIVLACLRQAPQGRAELARMLGLSKPTLGEVVGGLLEDGVIVEQAPTPTMRGRHPARLVINPERFVLLGIDLSPKVGLFNLYDATGQLLQQQKHRTLGKNAAQVSQALLEICRDIQQQCPHPLAAISIAAPGPINSQEGRVLAPINFPAIKGLSVKQLQECLQLPILLEHDSTAAAQHYLRSSQAQNFVYVLLTEGIGAGIVIGRQVYRGHFGFAAEFGNILVYPEAKHSLEHIAGPEGLVRLYHQATKQTIGLVQLADLARQGQSDATAVFDIAGRALAWGLSLLVNLLDPACVVLGGPGAHYADCFLPSFEAHFRQHRCPIHIDTATDPIASGAAQMALSALDQSQFPLPLQR